MAALRDQVFHGLATHEARGDARGRGGRRWPVVRGCALVEHALAPYRCRWLRGGPAEGPALVGGNRRSLRGQGPAERGPRHATY
ncbi:hypothetical protein SHJG_2891 [Streptomyces hygroscopicus subsp. jinggangensis 5008]|nr:hypothetical protein SHJG_2891 [Streptomyces hygroscopicus subsp. jinggangensis 5008]AGF62321.1 hypothetical protein SHJGH_2655 [Streptomyces hygroscopicus subsp. jinggangensis TL01]